MSDVVVDEDCISMVIIVFDVILESGFFFMLVCNSVFVLFIISDFIILFM